MKIPSENTSPLLEPKLDRDCKAKLQTRLYNLFDKDSWGLKVKESKSILEMLTLWNPRMYSSMNDLEFLVLLEVFEAHLRKRPFKIFLCRLGMEPHTYASIENHIFSLYHVIVNLSKSFFSWADKNWAHFWKIKSFRNQKMSKIKVGLLV